jgi:hypothetical protein
LLIALPKSCQSASSSSVFLALACKCPRKCETAVLPEWECVGRQAQPYFVLVCCLCIDAGMLGEIPVKLRAWGTYVCTEGIPCQGRHTWGTLIAFNCCGDDGIFVCQPEWEC